MRQLRPSPFALLSGGLFTQEGKIGDVVASMASLGLAAKDSLVSVLGIHSPSRVMMQAGGFTAQAAIDATIAGMLPQEDPASCAETALSATTIQVPLQPSTQVNMKELGCAERTTDAV